MLIQKRKLSLSVQASGSRIGPKKRSKNSSELWVNQLGELGHRAKHKNK